MQEPDVFSSKQALLLSTQHISAQVRVTTAGRAERARRNFTDTDAFVTLRIGVHLGVRLPKDARTRRVSVSPATRPLGSAAGPLPRSGQPWRAFGVITFCLPFLVP
eukprot:2538851-Prymnesium_polylepis.2